MNKSFFLLASILLMGFSSLGQNSVALPLIDIQSNYHGCCMPVRMAPARCTPLPILNMETIENSDEDLLDITDPEISGLMASPNPTKGYLNVSVPASLIGYEIQVYDMTGRFVGSPIEITGTSENLNLVGESGTYLIVIKTENEIITERVVLDTQ